MPRYKLRTLLIVLALGPPLLAPIGVWGWREFVAWRNARSLPAGSKPYLGATIEPSPDEAGARVARVHPGSPAEAGGLAAGDVIYSVKNRPCTSDDVITAVIESKAGTKLPMAVRRNGKTKSI